MPFNFGSIFSAVGRALPGYVEGERMAMEDNWRDLNEYNKVQAGQLQNAWDVATWTPRLTNVRLNTENNAINRERNLMQMGLDTARYPYEYERSAAMSANRQPLVSGEMAALMRMYQQMMQNGWGMPQMPYYGGGANMNAAGANTGAGLPSRMR